MDGGRWRWPSGCRGGLCGGGGEVDVEDGGGDGEAEGGLEGGEEQDETDSAAAATARQTAAAGLVAAAEVAPILSEAHWHTTPLPSMFCHFALGHQGPSADHRELAAVAFLRND